jgi:uncharacterized protein
VNMQDMGGRTPLMAAALSGSLPVARALLAKQAKLDATDGGGSNALIYAAANGHVDVVQFLEDAGLKSGGDTALAFAVAKCQTPVAEALLKAGAKPVGMVRGSPLAMLAASSGCVDTLNLLVANGADVNAKAEDGTTAFMAAAMNGFLDVGTILIDHGADIEAKNDNMQTAETLAARAGNFDFVNLIKAARDKKK